MMYTLVFAALLGVSLWMYGAYSKPKVVEDNTPRFTEAELQKIDQASMQSSVKFSEEDMKLINSYGAEEN